MKHKLKYWLKRQGKYINRYNISIPLPDNWEELRDKIKARDKVCIDCGGAGHGVHHINRDRTDSELSNLVYLCWDCHMKRHHSSQ